jgi:hypothetical protein
MNNTARVLVVIDSEKVGNWWLGRQEYPEVSQNTAIVLTGTLTLPIHVTLHTDVYMYFHKMGHETFGTNLACSLNNHL